MAGHDIIVIGASAGGVEALTTIVAALPPDIPATIFIVVHIPAQSPSMLPNILNRAGALEVFHAVDHGQIKYGRVYVAPPDHHVLIERDHIRVIRGPKENRHRPAVDVLFRSAAQAYGPRVVGLVLTGSLDDGTAGLQAIKRRGGIAVVQDPDEAQYPGMPQSALRTVAVDRVLPIAEIAPYLTQIAAQPAPDEGSFPVPDEMKYETRIAQMDQHALNSDDRPGAPSNFSCPECGGVLHEIHDGQILRFRCRVGHAFSTESVLAEQAEALEDALWTALNTLEENASLLQRLAHQAMESHHEWLAERYTTKFQEAEKRANILRQVLLVNDNVPEEEVETPPFEP